MKHLKILNLTLSKEWFDMILSGVKKEEYREIKPYWDTRLLDTDINHRDLYQKYDAIRFTNGYGNAAPFMIVEFKGISTGQGNEQWGATRTGNYYKIALGEVIAYSVIHVCAGCFIVHNKINCPNCNSVDYFQTIKNS